MRSIFIVMILPFGMLGCAKPGPELPSQTAVRKVDAIVGTYYEGDGLGFNLELTLEEEGRFQCKAFGCTGDHGSTSGTWSRSGDKITMTVTDADGTFVDTPLGNIIVVPYQGEERLLREVDADLLTRPELLRVFLFKREEPDTVAPDI